MKKLLIAIGLAGALGACSAIKMDAGAAATLATADGHPERAACYTAIGGLAGTAPAGLLSGYETALEGRALVTGPCAPIVAGLGLHLLDKLPVTP